MARTALTVQELSGPYPGALTLDALTWAAADVANSNDFTFTGKEIILARNDDASPQLVTLESIAGPHNRTGDVVLTPASGAYAMYQATGLAGWIQSTGKFHLKAATTTVFFAIVRLK